MSSNEVSIYNTFDSFEADSVVALLKGEGIPSYKREHGAGQYLSILFGANTTQNIEIIIPEDCEDRALHALEGAGFLLPMGEDAEDDGEEDEYIGTFVEFHGIECRVSYIEGYDEKGALYVKR